MLSGSFSLKKEKRFSPADLIESYQISELSKVSRGDHTTPIKELRWLLDVTAVLDWHYSSSSLAQETEDVRIFYSQFRYNIHHLVSSFEFAYVAICIYQISSSVGIFTVQGGFHKKLCSSGIIVR